MGYIIGFRVSQNEGYPFWGAPIISKDHTILGSILGSPYFGTTMGEKLALLRGFRPKRPAASLVIVHIYIYM